MTVEKFAEMFGVEPNVAYGLLRFLKEKQLCKTGKLPQPEGKKGKPATLYMLDETVGAKLVELLVAKLGQLNIDKLLDESVGPEASALPAICATNVPSA